MPRISMLWNCSSSLCGSFDLRVTSSRARWEGLDGSDLEVLQDTELVLKELVMKLDVDLERQVQKDEQFNYEAPFSDPPRIKVSLARARLL
jgi:hypothetical protein